MLFSSMTFVFLFLPIVCGLYFFARKEFSNIILLLASILFYAWGEPSYVYLMLGTILANYIGALCIDKYKKHKKLALIATLFVDLGLLFYFKYFNFVLDNINTVFNADFTLHHIIMPIGISFYTFQAISYLVDVYRQEVPVQKNLYKLALYITFFPQLVAGPIVKYHDVANQIDHRQVRFDGVVYGIKRFIIGLAKKMLLANTMGQVADTIFAMPVTDFGTGVAWVGALAYTLQLFFDFAGYSDMAIGLGHIFGFKFLENFNYPYISKSITEFWRRWHISLSTWFKEYLYIPLGGNRISKRRTYINLFIVFLATGIWHGAAWTFVIWGIWHGIFIVAERITGIHKKETTKTVSFFQHTYTILAFVIGWVIFRADNIKYAFDYVKNMFGLMNTNPIYKMPYFIDTTEILVFFIAILCSMPIFKNILSTKTTNQLAKFGINTWLIVLFVLSWSAMASGTYNPFIYFRF